MPQLNENSALPQCPKGCLPYEMHRTTVILDLSGDTAQYCCVRCNWQGQMVLGDRINPSFIFNMIAKYNRSTRQTQKDTCLYAVGVHAGLLKKGSNPLPVLSDEERDRVRYFLQQFLASQKLEVKLKD